MKLTKEEQHKQCMKEIRATLIIAVICCIWHVGSAFLLNGTGMVQCIHSGYDRACAGRRRISFKESVY